MNAAIIRIGLAALLFVAGCVKLANTEAPAKVELEVTKGGDVCALGTTCR